MSIKGWQLLAVKDSGALACTLERLDQTGLGLVLLADCNLVDVDGDANQYMHEGWRQVNVVDPIIPLPVKKAKGTETCVDLLVCTSSDVHGQQSLRV